MRLRIEFGAARRTLAIAGLLVGLAMTGITAAQEGQEPTAPADLKSPPADAAKAPSGLVSKVLTPGTSTEKPSATDVVTLHYTGWSSEGRIIDNSRSRETAPMFPLNKTMAGLRECVQLMVIGETRRCWIPQNLAYAGQSGKPTGTVVFDVELIDTRQNPTIAPPDVKAPPSDAKRNANGIAFKTLRPGTGTRHPSAFDRVTVHYTGWTTDGRMFDSSVARGTPATFGLDGGLIRGWTEGVPLMVEGERTRFWIPEALAYQGQQGQPAGMLVFDIDLIRIE